MLLQIAIIYRSQVMVNENNISKVFCCCPFASGHCLHHEQRRTRSPRRIARRHLPVPAVFWVSASVKGSCQFSTRGGEQQKLLLPACLTSFAFHFRSSEWKWIRSDFLGWHENGANACSRTRYSNFLLSNSCLTPPLHVARNEVPTFLDFCSISCCFSIPRKDPKLCYFLFWLFCCRILQTVYMIH